MRVLFVATPGVGHAFPMVPLAWALRSAGHEVLVATGGPGLAVAGAGLHVADVAPRFDQPGFWVPVMAKIARENPELHEQLSAMRGAGRVADLRNVAGLLSRLSEYLVEGTLSLAHDWEPDLLVQSGSQGAGLVVAAKLGIPLVDHGIGLTRTAGLHELHREHMAQTFDRYGVVELPQRRVALDVAPPSMASGPAEGWPMRFVPYNGGGELPEWLSARPAAVRVAVTLGTVSNRSQSGASLLRQVVSAAAELDVELVLAVGPDTDLSALGPLPTNVRAAGWLPLAALLPSCGLIVHHGGASTALTALTFGVPQLVHPDGGDRHITAMAVQQRGAGKIVMSEHLDADLLAGVLHDTSLRLAARAVSAEMRTMPAPAAVAQRLVSFAG